MNTVVALIVGAVVACFMWPSRKGAPDSRFDHRHLVAQTLVYGFICVIALAWPIQSLLLSDFHCSPWLVNACFGQNASPQQLAQPAYATYWALGGGLLASIGIFLRLNRFSDEVDTSSSTAETQV